MRKNITTLIVDDEAACIQTLVGDLKNFSDIDIIETTTSPEKAQKIIIKEQPELLFLDVEMPKKSGIELLQEIRPFIHSRLYVVFYSAYDKYIIDALRTSVFDFLLKPYHYDELESVLMRIRNERLKGEINFERSMRRLLSDDRKFAIQTLTGLRLLRRSDILYFEYTESSRCWQMIQQDRTVLKLRSNNTTSRELLNISSSFLQVNQSVILNIDYLLTIENSTLRCVLVPDYNDIEIKASRRYYAKMREALEII